MVDKVRLNYTLAKLLSREEKLRFRRITRELPKHQWNTIPKQETIIEYIQSTNERNTMLPGLALVRQEAAKDPTNADKMNALNTWMLMVSRVERKLTTLRNEIGLNAKKEADLNKSIEAKGMPKGGHEIKPWEKI